MSFKNILIIIFLVTVVSSVKGQKTSNTQKGGMRAPANFIVDGRADEWNNKLQAYNNATDIGYTICNDDKKLYLTVQAADHTIINKILGGGLIFSIDTIGNHNLKKAISIMYPVLDMHNRIWVNVHAKPIIIPGSASSISQADSFMNVNNKQLSMRSKLIRVSGLTGVDTLISIYNRNGIRAVAKFNNEMVYTYELSIELKLLGIDVINKNKFNYNIKLPGVDLLGVYAAAGVKAFVDPHSGYVISFGQALPGYSQDFIDKNPPSLPPKIFQSMFIPSSDFWSEYKLVN